MGIPCREPIGPSSRKRDPAEKVKVPGWRDSIRSEFSIKHQAQTSGVGSLPRSAMVENHWVRAFCSWSSNETGGGRFRSVVGRLKTWGKYFVEGKAMGPAGLLGTMDPSASPALIAPSCASFWALRAARRRVQSCQEVHIHRCPLVSNPQPRWEQPGRQPHFFLARK